MSRKAFNEDTAWKDAQDSYYSKRYDESISRLDTLIKKTANPAFYCYIKTNILVERNKISDAIEVINQAIEFNPAWSQPYQVKAAILYNYGYDLNEALNNINTAIQKYTPSPLAEAENSDSLLFWVQGFVAERSDMINLKTSVESDIRSNMLYAQMQTIESNVDKKLGDERQRSFEMLGVFAAIIALVLATATSARSLQGIEFLWLGLGLVVPISFLVMLVSPRFDNRLKGMITIIGLILTAGLVGFFIRGYTG